jgi:RNA polymerase primary sigma factor
MSTTDDIKEFIAIASKYKVLSREEERVLLLDYKINGVLSAREKLIKHNFKLVISIAKRHIGKGLDFSELCQEGLIGLTKAIEKYDVNRTVLGRNIKLSTLSVYWIRQSITRALDNHGAAIRIPIHRLNEIRTIRREFGRFREEKGREPTSEELEALIAISAEKDPKVRSIKAEEIRSLGTLLYNPVSLNEYNSDDENLTLLDYLSADTMCQPEEQIETNHNKGYVKELLTMLSADDRAFIIYKFGLLDGRERDKKEMSSKFRRMGVEEAQRRTEQILGQLAQIACRDQTNLD